MLFWVLSGFFSPVFSQQAGTLELQSPNPCLVIDNFVDREICLAEAAVLQAQTILNKTDLADYQKVQANNVITSQIGKIRRLKAMSPVERKQANDMIKSMKRD